MLRFILGGAGAGKTSFIINEIKARMGDNSGMVLLTPEQYSHRAERMLASACGPSLSLYAEVLSFTRLYNRVATQLGGLADYIPDKGGKLLIMNLALEAAAPKLRYYGSRSRRAEFLSLILETAEELNSAMIGTDMLLEASQAADGTIGDKLYDMALICEAYNAMLGQRLGDSRDRLQRLADNIDSINCTVGCGGFYIDGFTDFTAVEYEVIDGILKKGYDVTVALTYKPGGAEHFRLTEATFHRLASLAQRRFINVETVCLNSDKPYTDTALAYIADKLFDYTAPPLKNEVKSVELYRMNSPLRECRLAAARILELVREDESLRFSNFIVASPSYEAYSSVLAGVFRDYNIPLYSGEKGELCQKSLIAFLLEALSTVTGGWLYRNIFRYLKTGLTYIAPDDRDLLENYCLTWDICGESMWTRPEPWDMNPRGYVPDKTEADTLKLSRINMLRKQVSEPLKLLSDMIKAAETASGHIYALWRFIEETSLSEMLLKKAEMLLNAGMTAEAEEQSRLWDILIDCLEQFSGVLGSSEMDGEEFIRMLELLLSSRDIGAIPASLDSVAAGSLNRLKGNRPECLIILGADDSSLPSVQDSGGLFSAEERRKMFDLGIRLGSDRDEGIYRELHGIYQSVGSADRHLIVTYTGGENRRPSLLINRAKTLLNLKIKNESELEELYNTAAYNPCFSLALTGAGETAAAAKECVDKAELARLLSLVNTERGSLSPEAVANIYGSRFNLTATRAETFNSCQFMYFMQYGLKAKERRKAGFEAPQMGTFVHYILENVTAEAKALGGYKKLSENEVRRLAGRYTAEYARLYLTDTELKNPRFSYLFNRLRAAVDSIVLDVAAELSVSDFEPLDFELQFADGGALPPAEVGDLRISGMVDRVDGWLNKQDGKLYLRVADYKTGRKEFSFSDVRYGVGIQMLIYLFVLAESGYARYGREIVPAGVLYTPARDVLLSMPRSSSAEDIAKKRADTLRRSGLILSDEAVLRAMENTDDTRFIPVKYRDGAATGNIASLEMFGKLGKYIKLLLESMGKDLKNGCIAANPLEKGKSHSPCLYCPYTSACSFNNKDTARRQYSIRSDDFWQLINSLDDTAEGGGMTSA